MSKSITELRASAHVGLPERAYRLCLATKVLAEVQDLCTQLAVIEERKAEVDAKLEKQAEDESSGADGQVRPPRRAAEKVPPSPLRDELDALEDEEAPIRSRIAELREEMDEHTGVVTLVGIKDGDWRTWCDEHPPREDNKRDLTIARGFCNADALVEDLERYVKAWNGEDLKPAVFDAKGQMTEAGDWAFLRENAAPADISQMAAIVVEMHESLVDLPKLSSALRGIPSGAKS